MNKYCRLIAGVSTFLACATLAHSEGLLGKRYLEVGVATDSDFDDFGFGLAYNMPIKADMLDLAIELGRDEEGIVETAVIDVTFYAPVSQGSLTKVYIAPVLGYFQAETGYWWSPNVSDLVYGVSVGTEYELAENSNLTTSISYLDSEDFGDFGVSFDVGYNHWFTDSFNGEIALGYNTESEDASFSLSARWAF
ncbi:hypothetical protein [Pelagicoccus sp. SDUM812003]|uniref:hypothetical protein n=1 Tax=Pelagicoccus sp. SDUM812003 TaxID=3041267 RepID=UPI00280EBF19|nr:hypothetical protein [Pelagicoccus sp. SDUM812003]MDQ8201898.1 hypothetical protein [Pelagicoccus sp. SDUM812003]